MRFKSERNESREAMGFILQFAQLPQMIDPLRGALDMSVKHRAGAAPAHLVPRAMHIQPLRRGFFSSAKSIPHPGIENFRAAARD